MRKAEINKALKGHPQADAIREVLAMPTEAHESDDRRAGYVVGQGEIIPETGPEEAIGTVHRMAHWNCGFDAEGQRRHDIRQKEKRARHGLQFLERPHRKGRFAKTTPATRRKVQAQYKAQCQAEAVGEHWEP